MLRYQDGRFYMDGAPFSIHSGAIHYFRTLPQQWEDRLQKLKDCGLNTVETYCCWNMHEPKQGQFCFEGMLDVSAFLSLAEKLGLYVIVRPGPYICAEWEFGGMPAWLLADDGIRLRTTEERYFAHVRRYMQVLMDQIRPHLQSNGGNVILLAVENEYGSFGNSREYMNKCAKLLRDCGGDVPLVTADGHLDIFLNGGMADGVLPALDFGYDHDILPVHFDALGKLAPQVPQFHLEHWIGAFSHWDAPVLRYPAEDAAREVSQQLAQGIDFNLYMFHGGTNFGFFNGANHTADDPENRIKNRYEPDITSYDYDAPLTEWGECTPKYFAIQKEMERYLGKTLPKPAQVPLQNIGAVQLNAYAPLFENLENIGQRFTDCLPRNMEAYGQSYGYILYRNVIKTKQKIDLLAFREVYDRVTVFFNGVRRGVVYRNDPKQYLEVDGWMDEGGVLELLVENMGRINFGPDMCKGDRKGICDSVYISVKNGPRQILCDWEVYTLPMDDLTKLSYTGSVRAGQPGFWKGSFRAEQKDCFVHLHQFSKGFVTVNGFNLGRFWEKGPQMSLYLPWPILKEENEIIVYAEDWEKPEIVISDEHILTGGNTFAHPVTVL
ncbi:MAG: beta-galactosidase [Oscillospiraceae bacterium]|nr:beta-galactosidase [Oscillospiraceae bacterium]